MLDINFVRGNPDAVRKDLEKRGEKEKLRLVDSLLSTDSGYRKLLTKLQNLQHERNEISLRIAEIVKKGGDTSEEKKKAAELPGRISESEEKVNELAIGIRNSLMKLPNILHESVPVGESDEDNVVVREVGEKPEFDFKPKDHVDLVEGLGMADIERAAKISGARFYFLKGDLVKLDLSLIQFALDELMKKGFLPIEPPFMMRRAPYEGVVDLEDFEKVMYKIDGEDLYLIATSEHPLIGMHMDEIIDEGDLPLRYVGISTNFRKEAGTHGKYDKGVFRVHQFNKVEQIVICKPEDSWKIHEELIKNSEEIFSKLGVPYRVVNVCTGDIGTMAAKKYDIEAWMPAEGKYREVVSCSNCTSYQAVRLNMRYGKYGGKKNWVHTINATGLATPRTILAILENYQQKDGSIIVPEVLRPYFGKDRIESIKKIKSKNIISKKIISKKIESKKRESNERETKKIETSKKPKRE